MTSPFSNASSPGSVGLNVCKARTRVTIFPLAGIVAAVRLVAADVVDVTETVLEEARIAAVVMAVPFKIYSLTVKSRQSVVFESGVLWPQ